MNSKYKTYLTDDLGMTDTRADEFDQIIGELHRSIAKMDAHNLRLMWTAFDGLMNNVAEYADNNSGLNDFREWNK